KLIPAVDVAELDPEDCTLEAVHARVPADLVVIVAAAHAVLAQHLHALGQFVGVGGDHAGVSGCTQILGWIKAESGDVAKAAGLAPQRRRPVAGDPAVYAVPLRAPGLGGVFNEFEPM